MTVNMSVLAGAGWQFFSNDGDILSGGKLYTYLAGSTTPATTWTSSAGDEENENPIILDSSGRVEEEIWLDSDTTYKFVLKDSLNNEIWTKDDISGILTDINNLLVTATNSTTPRSLANRFGDWVNVKDFGALGDGSTNDRAAFAAADGVGPLLVPPGTYRISSSLTIANAVQFMAGAKLTIDTGAVVTFAGTVIASARQQIISGVGTAVMNRNTPWLYPEWWGATAINAAAQFINLMVAAATASLVPVFFDGTYNLETLVTMPPGLPVDSAPGSRFVSSSGNLNGLRVTAGSGPFRMNLPAFDGFGAAALNLRGVSYMHATIPFFTNCGTSLSIETVNASYANAASNIIEVGSFTASSYDVYILADNSSNNLTGNQITANTTSGSLINLFIDGPSLSLNLRGTSVVFGSTNALARPGGFCVHSSAADVADLNYSPGALDGVPDSSNIISGVFNNLRMHSRMQSLGSYSQMSFTGAAAQIEMGMQTQTLPIEATNSADGRASFNGGVPVNTNSMWIKHTAVGNIVAGATETCYVYHPATGTSAPYLNARPAIMNGAMIDNLFLTGSHDNEIQVVLRNVGTATITAGTEITFYVDVGYFG